MSDIWHDDDDGGEHHVNETSKLEQSHYNAGYLEGITVSKEQFLQKGFDEEYPVGAKIGLKVGNIVGKLQGLGLIDLEVKALRELSLQTLFSEEYFDPVSVEPKYTGEHPLVAKWQALVDAM